MMRRFFFSIVLIFPFMLSSNAQEVTDVAIDKEMEYLNKLYLHLHQNPELSLQEKNTSLKMAEELRRLGFDVTEEFGGYGVVGLLRNGEGPTILVRTDMDALPVTEVTGLSYASTVKAIDHYGNDVGVMHACGHDIHMSVWIGTARVLSEMKNKWKGTLLFIAQGAEEMGLGAKAMIDAGLFEKFSRPDYNLAIHDDPSIPAGSVALYPGFIMANVDMVDITVFGVGGHGALPHKTIDPVVIASRIVLDLQTIISRELSPLTPAVITIGKIDGGTVGNVIPEKVEMQLTVRSFSDEVRSAIFEKIERICNGIAMASGVPEDKMPVVKVKDQFTPSLYNDPDLTDRIRSVFNGCLGQANVFDSEPRMIGEDFSRYGRQEPPIPSLMFRLGTTAPDLLEKSKKGEAEISGLHSSKFAPDYSLTIRTGVKAMSCAVMDLLNEGK